MQTPAFTTQIRFNMQLGGINKGQVGIVNESDFNFIGLEKRLSDIERNQYITMFGIVLIVILLLTKN